MGHVDATNDNKLGFPPLKKPQYLFISFLVPFYFLLVGCGQDDQKINALSKQIAELKHKIYELEIDQGSFRSYVRGTIDALGYNYASFTPSSKGYQKINTDTGPFLISLSSIEKYAGGYKLLFEVGNLNSVLYSDAEMTVEFGKPYDGKVDYWEWKNSLGRVDAVINKSLIPNTWNNVSVVLSPAKESDLQYLKVSLSPKKALLLRDFRSEAD